MRGPELPGGYSLHLYDRIDSTSAEAARLREGGAPAGTVVMARSQSAGRGRRERQWHSPEGNLYLSVVLDDLPAGRPAAGVSFAAALAVRDAILDHAPTAPLSLKWPNDVLADGRKLSGVLVERADRGWIAGVGVNLVSSPPDADVSWPATNLNAACGAQVPAEDMAAALCRHLDIWHGRLIAEGFEPLRVAWLASGSQMGDMIAVSDGARVVEGRFAGLECDGSMLVEDAAGSRLAISAGDVLIPGGT